MRIYQYCILALILGVFSQHTLADNISKLPPAWQPKLKPVIAVDLSPLKVDEQNAINDGRSQINELLSSATTDTEQLASAYGKLGNLYLIHELLTSANTCYENAISLQADHFPWRYYSAYLAHKNGEIHLALDRYQKAMELDPGYLPAKYRLAEVLVDLNRPEDATKLFSELLQEPDFLAAANFGLGQVFQSRQEHDKAIDHFNRALELQPQANKIHYPLAMSLRATGQIDQAKEQLKEFGKQEIVIKDPLVDALQALRNPASRHFAAAMTGTIRKDYSTAAIEFGKGLEYETDNLSARTSYARVLYLNGDKDEARAQLKRVVSADPDKSLSLFLLALLYDESGELEAAAKLYHRVLEMDPKHEGANFFLGNYYLRRKDYTKAIQHYDLTIQSNEKNIPAQLFRMVAMMGDDRPDQDLLVAVSNITDRAPGMISIKRIQILLLALSSDEKVRNAESAVKLATQAYQIHKYPANLELLALATAANGDFTQAKEQMLTALSNEEQHKNSQNIARITTNLSLLEQGKLPALNWSKEINYMLPPPTKALSTFRDYPDPNPI